MKTAISIPNDLFESAEAYAKRQGFTRSELFVKALRYFLRSHRDVQITEGLDRVYTQETNALDPVTEQLQAASLAEDEW